MSGDAMQETSNETVMLLLQAREGDLSAHARLFVHLQQELKRIAQLERYRWHGNETMNATAILHEAYIKLTEGASLTVQDRSHFLAVAGKAMRQVLQDYARSQKALKRGGATPKISLDLAPESAVMIDDPDLLDISDALDRLEADYPDLAAIVECRFFSGMTIDDTATALDLGTSTVRRRWTLAQSLLYTYLMENA